MTQNVLGACNFDLNLIMALAGWESSAHDSRVLNDAVRIRRILPLFENWFYLGDAGYGLTRWCLTPFGDVRYHLNEWNAAAAANVLRLNEKELYNMRHSSLRNVIERTYGIVKARFPILRDMPSGYSLNTQISLVLTSFLIHNFIRINQDDDDNLNDIHDNMNEGFNGGIDGDGNELDVDEEEHGVDVENVEAVNDYNAALQWRQGIADAMWAKWILAHPPA